MTKSVKTWQSLPLIMLNVHLFHQELKCNVCQLENMFSFISDQAFICQTLQWNLHQAELTPRPT